MDFLPGSQGSRAPIRSRGELPHLYRAGGTYFITFRLADAVLPPAARERHVAPIGGEDFEPAELLAGYEPPITLGSCYLSDRGISLLVQDALLHFHHNRYELLAWCIMPNHVHAVVSPFAGFAPDQILHSWKSFTAHKANRLLGRQGTFWERESFDHLVRSIASLERFIRYTEDNPVVARLCGRPEDWEFSSARHSILRVP